MTESFIRYSAADGIGTILIDRAEKRNALTIAMYEEIIDALQVAAKDPMVRVVRVRGAGEVFTSGNDIKDFMNLAASLQGDPMESAVVRLLFCFADFEKPLVGEVRGPAVGIGTTMLLHFDLVYAGTSARFHMPFVPLGLCPEGASSLLLPMIAGHRRAAEMLMLAEPFDATAAREVGIVNAVIPDDKLSAHVDERCAALLKLPAASLRLTKRLLKDGQRELVKKTLVDEVREFALRLSSPESAEAFSAFLEKRAPDFSQFE